MSVDPVPAYAGLRGARGAQVFNQTAFRHFLAFELTRARRRQRCLFLVLVALRERPGRSAVLRETATTAIFGGLCASAREVDFVGWFREAHVAAAVMVQGSQAPEPAATGQVAARARKAIEARLPPSFAARLRVRVVRLGTPLND